MFGNKVYELPLSRDYVSKWGVVEAVRELLQNAIDSSSPFDVAQVGSIMLIKSSGVRLDPSTLVLGRTSKAEDADSIGQFGEGYKLAMLVLTREGISVNLANNDVVWAPEFRKSSQFGIETLHIVETKMDKADRIDGIAFAIIGLSGDDQEAIKASCLHMQPTIADAIETSYGRILPSHPGKLFVGGLFVCKTDLDFGYDFNAGEIELERDRQTVGGFELKWKTKDVWTATGDYDTIAAMLERDSPDVSMNRFGAVDMVKEACYRHFVNKHPGAVIASSQQELESLVGQGMMVAVYPEAFKECVSQSAGYNASGIKPVLETPTQALAAWYDEHKRYMSRMPAVAFKKLMARSKKWKAQ